jgi:hypothetical protein
MHRLLAAALVAALLLSFASPTLAVTASLSVVEVIVEDPAAGIAGQNSITFQSDTYKGQSNRILVWQCSAPFAFTSATPSIDKRTGQAKVYFRNGFVDVTGTLYCVDWTAWVALIDDWQTPISPVLTGAF